MDDSKETELKRRDVLKRGAVATGALVVGGTAMSGSATAKKGGVGFTGEGRFARGDTFSLAGQSANPDPIAAECESGRFIKKLTQYTVTSTGGLQFWVKGGADVDLNTTYEIKNVKSGCTLMRKSTRTPFAGAKYVFGPAKP